LVSIRKHTSLVTIKPQKDYEISYNFDISIGAYIQNMFYRYNQKIMFIDVAVALEDTLEEFLLDIK
jgi:hypothetical protein